MAAPTSSIETRLRAGALACALSSSSSNSAMPEAARVFSGPGEMACTRMPLGPELGRQVASRALQRRLDRPHHVVVLHHHLRAVVGHGEQRAAVGHQRLGQLRHADERPAGDLHGRRGSPPWSSRRRGPAGPPSARRRSSAAGNRAGPSARVICVEHRLELAVDPQVAAACRSRPRARAPAARRTASPSR